MIEVSLNCVKIPIFILKSDKKKTSLQYEAAAEGCGGISSICVGVGPSFPKPISNNSV